MRRAVEDKPYTLGLVPNHLEMQEMCNEAVCRAPETLEFVPDHLKTQALRERAAEDELDTLGLVPDCLKTQKMCIKTVEVDHSSWKMSLIILRHRKCVIRGLK